MLKMYPVGSIYASTVSTNPGTLFGGTWEALPAGRVLLAQGTSEWGTEYAAGSTGGEATHTLTIGELPSHNHGPGTLSGYYKCRETDDNGSAAHGAERVTFTKFDVNSDGDSVVINSGTTANTGSGAAHNNLQPYIAVFLWKRVN